MSIPTTQRADDSPHFMQPLCDWIRKAKIDLPSTVDRNLADALVCRPIQIQDNRQLSHPLFAGAELKSLALVSPPPARYCRAAERGLLLFMSAYSGALAVGEAKLSSIVSETKDEAQVPIGEISALGSNTQSASTAEFQLVPQSNQPNMPWVDALTPVRTQWYEAIHHIIFASADSLSADNARKVRHQISTWCRIQIPALPELLSRLGHDEGVIDALLRLKHYRPAHPVIRVVDLNLLSLRSVLELNPSIPSYAPCLLHGSLYDAADRLVELMANEENSD